jgi:hypothetical protein
MSILANNNFMLKLGNAWFLKFKKKVEFFLNMFLFLLFGYCNGNGIGYRNGNGKSLYSTLTLTLTPKLAW